MFPNEHLFRLCLVTIFVLCFQFLIFKEKKKQKTIFLYTFGWLKRKKKKIFYK